ncbi:hypothetical protein GOP47_0019458 [Adiantum capillus-veneris]|uniref:Uncharacterized protein n=1 Tax=Adiantum capillus-veneris TaxID=13818 RepID=A0A9D4Z732_ADICA|nr:hypothetical protein GOP47_0019458 [Adiantum capillus-veneris]
MAWQPPLPSQQVPLYDDLGGAKRPASGNPLGYGAGEDILRSGLGAYGEKLFGTSREYVQSNISRYFSGQNFQYYFQVNDQYVKNKLKVILFPFLHKGHWTRIAEQVAGGLTFRPPVFDINAPDLYIPLMAFGTFIVLSGIAFGLFGKGAHPHD